MANEGGYLFLYGGCPVIQEYRKRKGRTLYEASELCTAEEVEEKYRE